MKRIIHIVLLACCALSFFVSRAYPAAYEASTLHNAVSRSETVQDLFFKRWSMIQEKELYFDLYGKINWVPDFEINAVNSGTNKKESVPMTLVRTYGSVTIAYPVLGTYEGDSWSERASGKAKKLSEEEDKGSGPMGLWKPRNLVLGFTATGFHYGLTRRSEVSRGPAGSESVSDYKYTQFFDDLFALSVLYRPYIFIHGGIIINNQIEPNDDGTMDYGNSSERTIRYFFASNILSFLNANATATSDELEALAVGIEVNQILGAIVKNIHPAVPRLTVTYKMLKLFNDEPYDAVWVKTGFVDVSATTPKDSDLDDSEKDSAILHAVSFLIKENLFNYIFIDFFVEFQKPSEDLIEKRKIAQGNTDAEIEVDPLREIRVSLGYNFMARKAKQGQQFILSAGLSRYWDAAIPVHRNSGTNYYLIGGFGALKYASPIAGAELKVAYNYSDELRKLIETADKYALEGSAYISF